KGRLEMLESDREKMGGLAWHVKNRNVLVLIEQPDPSQFGADYRDATLSRHKAAEVERDAQFQPGKKVTLAAETADLVQEAMTVELPLETPYTAQSKDERRYLKGYAEGYADTVRSHVVCRSNVGERATESWREGWKYGTRAAEAAKPKRQ